MRIIRVFSFIVFLLQCGSLYPGGQRIWGVTEQEFIDSLSSREHPVFLRSDTSGFPLQDLQVLGEGAGFFLSFYEFADKNIVYRMLEYETERSSLYALFSARRLMQLLISDDLDSQAERTGRRLAALFPDDYMIAKAFVESRYWQEKDIAEDLERLRHVFAKESSADPEIALFAVVNSMRFSGTGSSDELDRLLGTFPAGDVHYRLSLYLMSAGIADFPDGINAGLFFAKALLAQGNHETAYPLYSALQPDDLTPALLEDYSLIVTSTRQFQQGIAHLEKLREQVKDTSLKHAILQHAGFMARNAGLHDKAGSFFSEACETAKERRTSERMRWYMIESLIKTDYSLFVNNMPSLLSGVADLSYYGDLLSSLIQTLLVNRKYEAIERIFDTAFSAGEPVLSSQSAYILLRLAQTAQYTPAVSSAVLVSAIENPSADIYYSSLFRHLNDKPAIVLSVSEIPVYEDGMGPDDFLVDGFFRYGLEFMAYDFLLPMHHDLSNRAVLRLVKGLESASRYNESIRAAYLLKGVPQNTALLYPRGYKKLVEQAAEQHAFPDWLFYSLIRTESLFDPDAVSRSGAVGLAQLMPATAADVMGRIKREGMDLKDPESNVVLGSWYLAHMISRNPLPAEAVMAYNGGPGNVRRWRAQWADLPLDLFIEHVPFTETRNYVKKIIRYSLHYAEIYDISTRENVMEYMIPLKSME